MANDNAERSHTSRNLPWVALLIVVAIAAFLLFKHSSGPQLCADDVRGYRESVESSLLASAKDLKSVEASLKGTTSQEYIEKLSQLQPADLLALKACDTQCKLLQRCLSLHPLASVQTACPSEYKDYNSRVEATLKLIAKIQDYEKATKDAAQKANALSTSQKELDDAKNGVGASGGRERVLEQRVEYEQRELKSKITDIDAVAKEIVESGK